MEKNNVAEALYALATSNESRSQTARLRDVIDAVEAALKAGVRREVVLQSLNDQGLKMSLKNFDRALYRIRKERKDNAGLHNPILAEVEVNGLHKPNLKNETNLGLHNPIDEEDSASQEAQHSSAIISKKDAEKKAGKYFKTSIGNLDIDNLVNKKKDDEK